MAGKIINVTSFRGKVRDMMYIGQPINILVYGSSTIYYKEVVVLQLEGPLNKASISMIPLLYTADGGMFSNHREVSAVNKRQTFLMARSTTKHSLFLTL